MMPVQVKSVGGYLGEGVEPSCIVRQTFHSYPSHGILCMKNWATVVEPLHQLCPTVFSALWHFLEKAKCMDVNLATGWTVQGSNPTGGQNFPHPSRLALEATQPPMQ